MKTKTDKKLGKVLEKIADGPDTDPRIAEQLGALVADGYSLYEAGALEPGDLVAYVHTDVFGMAPVGSVHTAKVRRVEANPRWPKFGLVVHHSGGETEIANFEYVLALKS